MPFRIPLPGVKLPVSRQEIFAMAPNSQAISPAPGLSPPLGYIYPSLDTEPEGKPPFTLLSPVPP